MDAEEPGSSPPRGDVTGLLLAWNEGDASAMERLMPLVYGELRAIAERHFRRERAGHTLQPTAVVHEAYFRLVDQTRVNWKNRGHFFAIASQAMRRILVDHARRRQAVKRGALRGQAQLDPNRLPAPGVDDDSWIDLDEALTAFQAVDAPAAELAKLRIFGGLTVEEAGAALGVPRATAFRVWTYARAWLTVALADRAKDS
jgi:RNA polymerase sigma factor (TIGR02999 family)